MDRQNVASGHADIVARLSKALDEWLDFAEAARLPEGSSLQQYDAAELERLRSLGYVE